MRATHPATSRRDALERDLARAQNAIRRLLDGYQEQLVTLDELRARTPELRKREATIQAQLDALDAELHDAETYLKLTETLDGFRARLTDQRREPDRRAAPTDHPARRPRGPDRRGRHHDPPLDPRPHTATSHPVIYCVRVVEKSQIQALDRTQPIAADASPGVPSATTHDYKRHGTTSLFAALDVADRQGDRPVALPRHRHDRVPEVPAARSTARSPNAFDVHLDPRQLRHPQPPRRQAHGWPSTRGSTCTSPRPRAAG